ncbi:DUF1801 domain-containing protein [Fulvivirga sp. RKSG066]|uniref:DUF1801 domain-containing protein n=1 Tax=Fulvivirga aurantia TaxID=2529383 RepID=UPI0012BD76C8|nr:DUF1801 domain-containing protein [Fulvivirga aurantia]MTI20605.1 DUF1801 domain-containing protein [Fulvivirga aurantia]
MEFVESHKVSEILSSYPQRARKKLLELRQLIIDTATATEGVEKLLETTKWGEPSYVSKTGSTIRMDWKENTPDKYYLYFICSTELVNTFKILYGEELQYQGNRAIELNVNSTLPKTPLIKCITLALTYHKVKHLPMLGV